MKLNKSEKKYLMFLILIAILEFIFFIISKTVQDITYSIFFISLFFIEYNNIMVLKSKNKLIDTLINSLKTVTLLLLTDDCQNDKQNIDENLIDRNNIKELIEYYQNEMEELSPTTDFEAIKEIETKIEILTEILEL